MSETEQSACEGFESAYGSHVRTLPTAPSPVTTHYGSNITVSLNFGVSGDMYRAGIELSDGKSCGRGRTLIDWVVDMVVESSVVEEGMKTVSQLSSGQATTGCRCSWCYRSTAGGWEKAGSGLQGLREQEEKAWENCPAKVGPPPCCFS